MYERIPQNVAKLIAVPVYLASDHLTGAISKTTLQITISKNGGAFGNPGGGSAVYMSELGNGFYSYLLAAGDLSAQGPLAVYIADTGAATDPVRLIFEVVDPNNAGLASLPSAAPGGNGGLPTVNASNQVSIGNVTVGGYATGQTPYQGTPPTAASIAALIVSGQPIVTDVHGNVTVGGYATGQTPYQGTPPTAASIAALIVTGQPLVTDVHGYVTINNTNVLTSDQITQLLAASEANQTVPPSATEIASAILSNTSMRLVVDSNGAVTANNSDFLTSTERTQLETAATN